MIPPTPRHQAWVLLSDTVLKRTDLPELLTRSGLTLEGYTVHQPAAGYWWFMVRSPEHLPANLPGTLMPAYIGRLLWDVQQAAHFLQVAPYSGPLPTPSPAKVIP